MISGRIACRSIAVVLAATLLPIGSASADDPVPPASGPQGEPVPAPAGLVPPSAGPSGEPAHRDPRPQADPVPPVSGPQSELVPGVPLNSLQLWQTDTPDQALAPEVYTPSAAEDAVEPQDAADGTYDRVEYVPREDAVEDVECTERTGPQQRQVEEFLKLEVDGEQSVADCRAIRAFQTKHKIEPASGFAGPVTWATMQLISARKNPNAEKKCPKRKYRVACVDLDRQLMWVQDGRKVVFGPVSIRSGREGYGTRTGWHAIYWRHKNHVSSLYHSPMPYSQFFNGGQAFHGVYGTLYTPIGSRGCVNMTLDDARALWGVLRKGDRLYVWGHRLEE
ncbi:L,D-transpeptidase [Streptomyces cyaneochromogenes]|uniref:L,D-transpeptidase n=1 Tax=Streptomyces cyaneochromogenes TaxID=2496836 RepID=A0A3S9MCA3_9ACTN|nr:L,D-transpeptidase [Streptomyces cyaneochromogenes]AZQ36810.1 L,D-transpeptidase [Streptomyces cyaneochromogenes]